VPFYYCSNNEGDFRGMQVPWYCSCTLAASSHVHCTVTLRQWLPHLRFPERLTSVFEGMEGLSRTREESDETPDTSRLKGRFQACCNLDETQSAHTWSNASTAMVGYVRKARAPNDRASAIQSIVAKSYCIANYCRKPKTALTTRQTAVQLVLS
jgi:hypothetical protein